MNTVKKTTTKKKTTRKDIQGGREGEEGGVREKNMKMKIKKTARRAIQEEGERSKKTTRKTTRKDIQGNTG